MKQYTKKLPYSYSIGVYPTIELLKYIPKQVERVYLSSSNTKNEGARQIKQKCLELKVKTIVDDGYINSISESQNCYAVGVFKKYAPTIEIGKNHLVLVNPEDLGNLGTIIRTMVGFGITNLALIRPAVDIFDPKVIRASMGALFQINWQYFETFSEYHKHYNNQLYCFMSDGERLLQETQFDSPFSLVFGSESSGLSKEFRTVGTSVRIPQEKTIDSLNLSIAVGIALAKVHEVLFDA